MSSDKKTSLQSLTVKTGQDPSLRTKEGLLHVLDNSFSNYSDTELTEQESEKLSHTLKRLSAGSSSFILLNCKGHKCPFAARCPLVQMGKSLEKPSGKAPLGQDCVLEASLLRDSIASYLNEYQVDPSNFTEVNIVTELAEIEVSLWRINMQLSESENALFVIDQTIAIDPSTGDKITQQQVSPLFEQKQKLATRKSKLMKLMVGDRQEKYKKEAALKQKPDSDASSQMSEIKKSLHQLQQKIKSTGKVLEGEVLSPEDFINSDPE